MTLDPEDVDAIAVRVVELLRESVSRANSRLVDAAEVARQLGVGRDWVYAHAAALGATRLGGGRGRLRFDLEQILRGNLGSPATPQRGKGGRRLQRRAAKRSRGDVELIPYVEVRCTGQANGGRGRRRNAPPTRPGG